MVAMLTRAWWTMCQRIPVSVLVDDEDCEEWETSAMKLTPDLMLMIFQRLPAKSMVSASLTCKAWKAIAYEERLWEGLLAKEAASNWKAVLFAESFLRPGFALRSPSLPLPFHMIYGQRSLVPRSIIIDGGAGYCKYGWGNHDQPLTRLPTFLEFGNIESPVYPRLKDLFATLFQCMQAKPSAQPVVLTTPVNNSDDTETALAARRQLREITFTVLFEMGVPAVCGVDQAVLALFAAQRSSGIVVNIGFHVTSIVPVLHGKVMRSIGVEIVGQGAMQLTIHLGELMRQNGRPFASTYAVRTLKEKFCYVAEDFEEEMYKDTEASCMMTEEGFYTLEDERYRAPEILFQPRLGNLRTMSLQQAVALCMEHCGAVALSHKDDEGWFKTIVLAGGTACIPGFAARLKKEVSKSLSSNHLASGINVIPPAHGPDSAWFGAKLLSNLSTFPTAWCVTRKQFKRYGTTAVHSMCFDDDSTT